MNEHAVSEMTFEEASSFYVLNLCSGQNLVNFACSALEKGIDSPSLRKLAGEQNPPMSEAGALFETVIVELGIPKPTKLQAQLNIAHYYARAIIEGRLTPYDGARKIWWEISNEIENPSSILLLFVGAASEIEDLPQRYENDDYDPTSDIEEYNQAIIRGARDLLRIEDPNQLLQEKK